MSDTNPVATRGDLPEAVNTLTTAPDCNPKRSAEYIDIE
jgi:hypothetical protein